MAVTSGIHAGRCISSYLAKTGEARELPGGLRELREMVFAPLDQTGRDVRWQEFEDVLQRAITEGLGPVRSAIGMEKAIDNLTSLKQWFPKVRAGNYHELCRVHELRNMLTVGLLIANAAMFRKESRFGQCHYREDFPFKDDQHWQGQVLVRNGPDNNVMTSFLPLNYD